jgi:hypothetical protein
VLTYLTLSKLSKITVVYLALLLVYYTCCNYLHEVHCVAAVVQSMDKGSALLLLCCCAHYAALATIALKYCLLQLRNSYTDVAPTPFCALFHCRS